MDFFNELAELDDVRVKQINTLMTKYAKSVLGDRGIIVGSELNCEGYTLKVDSMGYSNVGNVIEPSPLVFCGGKIIKVDKDDPDYDTMKNRIDKYLQGRAASGLLLPEMHCDYEVGDDANFRVNEHGVFRTSATQWNHDI